MSFLCEVPRQPRVREEGIRGVERKILQYVLNTTRSRIKVGDRRRWFTNEESEVVNLYIHAGKVTFEIAVWPLSILILFSCIVYTGVMCLITLDQLLSNLCLIPTSKSLNHYLTHTMKTL